MITFFLIDHLNGLAQQTAETIVDVHYSKFSKSESVNDKIYNIMYTCILYEIDASVTHTIMCVQLSLIKYSKIKGMFSMNTNLVMTNYLKHALNKKCLFWARDISTRPNESFVCCMFQYVRSYRSYFVHQTNMYYLFFYFWSAQILEIQFLMSTSVNRICRVNVRSFLQDLLLLDPFLDRLTRYKYLWYYITTKLKK